MLYISPKSGCKWTALLSKFAVPHLNTTLEYSQDEQIFKELWSTDSFGNICFMPHISYMTEFNMKNEAGGKVQCNRCPCFFTHAIAQFPSTLAPHFNTTGFWQIWKLAAAG